MEPRARWRASLRAQIRARTASAQASARLASPARLFKAAAAVAAAATSRLRQQNGARRRETGTTAPASGPSSSSLRASAKSIWPAARSARRRFRLWMAPAAARPASAGRSASSASAATRFASTFRSACSSAAAPSPPVFVSSSNAAAAFSQARQSAASFSASAARFWIWSAAMAQRAVGRCRGRWIRRLLRVVAIEVCFVGLCWPCGLVGLDESYSRAPPPSGCATRTFPLFCLPLRKIIFAHGQFIDQ